MNDMVNALLMCSKLFIVRRKKILTFFFRKQVKAAKFLFVENVVHDSKIQFVHHVTSSIHSSTGPNAAAKNKDAS